MNKLKSNIVVNFIYYYTRSKNILNIIKSFKFYCYNNIITHLPFHFFRIFFLRKILNIKIGNNVFIHMGSRFEGKIEIGNNSVVGRSCILNGNIRIGENVSITAECYFFSMSHFVNDSLFRTFDKTIIIEDYCWIGARAILLPGVIMGKGAVLGANSVATKKIENFEIHVGCPAKKINNRNSDLKYNLNYSPFFQ